MSKMYDFPNLESCRKTALSQLVATKKETRGQLSKFLPPELGSIIIEHAFIPQQHWLVLHEYKHCVTSYASQKGVSGDASDFARFCRWERRFERRNFQIVGSVTWGMECKRYWVLIMFFLICLPALIHVFVVSPFSGLALLSANILSWGWVFFRVKASAQAKN